MTTVVKVPKVFMDNFANILTDEDERMGFLPWLMDGNVFHGLTFESCVYQVADKLSDDYSGGFWDYATIKKNKTGVMLFDADKELTVRNQGNYSEAVVDGQVFGIIASIMVASHASFQFHESKPELSRKMAEIYHNLRDAFYATVDALAYPDEETDYKLDVKATEEEIEQIKLLSKTVWMLLD